MQLHLDDLLILSVLALVVTCLLVYRLYRSSRRSNLTDAVLLAILALLVIWLLLSVFSGTANAEERDGSSYVPVITTEGPLRLRGPIRLSPRLIRESVAQRKPFFQIVVNAEYWCQWTLHGLAVAREEGGVEFKKIASVFTARIDRTDVWTATYEICAELELIPKDLEE